MPGTLIRIEKQKRKSGGPRTVLICNCLYIGCQNEIKIRKGMENKQSGMCTIHSHRKRPFESIYNNLYNDWRKLDVALTYEEFLEFTNIKECHYCRDIINWQEYSIIDGEFTSRAYYLDRKDFSIGYTKDNCVVCCTYCNILRGNRFTYEEFKLFSPILERIRLNRKSLSK